MSFEFSEADEGFGESNLTAIACWRCDLETSAAEATCPHCGARLRQEDAQQSTSQGESVESKMVKALIGSFVFLLITSVVHYVMLEVEFGTVEQFNDELRFRVFAQMIVVEAIDSIIVAFVTILYFRQVLLGQSASAPISGWVLTVPMLAVLLGLNLCYHYVLRSILLQPLLKDELVENFDLMALLVMCVQPAIVEELYVRGFCMGTLLTITGKNAAVWVSAVMFGLLHIASPLSIPYLILFGGAMGYLRLMTGGLLAPVLLHFLHNLFVCLWN